MEMYPMEPLRAAMSTSTSTFMRPADPTMAPHKPELQLATEDGFRALWVVFTVMALSSGIFAALSWNVPIQRRLYHVITSLITITAAISYFGMASGTGVTMHCSKVYDSSNRRGGYGGYPDPTNALSANKDSYREVCREIYWARYVDWAVTTPLLLLDLCLLSGIDGAHTLMAIVADIAMCLTGLFAAFGNDGTAQKWGWYTISCFSYLTILWHVGTHGTRTVAAKGQKVVRLFGSLAIFTFVLWTAYPIVWAITDGSRKASVDTEIMAYALLDVLAKPVFGIWLLLSHRSVPETNVELDGYWTHGLSAEGRIRIGEDQ